MDAIEEAIRYCLNRPVNKTRRHGIPGKKMRKIKFPDELKRYDGGDAPVVNGQEESSDQTATGGTTDTEAGAAEE